MTSLHSRRSEIDAELENLRRQRGVATLDGAKFDDSKISALTAEQEALNEAEGEQTRRDREAAAARLEAERAKARKELAKLEDERQRALQDANGHARGLAESIATAIDTQGQMTQVAKTLSDGKIPLRLHLPDFVERVGYRLAAIMRTIPGRSARLGPINWSGHGSYKASDNWRECERKKLEDCLKPLLKGTPSGH